MGNSVFANGREISCKAGSGKSIAAFPDVCLSPPSPPAGPVPIPYPTTGMASDTDQGSKNVKIGGDPVMLKDQSNFKKCTGDEAATKSLGMSVVTHNITGKVYFCAWSMDVKIEGQNAVRHLDLMTHNHMSQVGSTPPFPFTERMKMAKGLKDCEKVVEKAEKACKDDKGKTKKCPNQAKINEAKAMKKGPKRTAALKKALQDYARRVQKDDCQKAARCILSPYDGKTCCPPQTPHHLLPKAGFYKKKYGGKTMDDCEKYDAGTAPCVCAEGGKSTGTHGLLHRAQANHIAKFKKAQKKAKKPKEWTYKEARKSAADAMKEIFGCPKACTEAQLKRGHKGMVKGDPELRPISERPKNIEAFAKSWTKKTGKFP